MRIIENGRHYAVNYTPEVVIQEKKWWDRPLLFSKRQPPKAIRDTLRANLYYLVKARDNWIYLYNFFYFFWDKNHQHDWTGSLLAMERVGQTLKKRALVCRDHWELKFSRIGEFDDPVRARLTTGAHSVKRYKSQPKAEYTIYKPGDNIRLSNLGTPNAQAWLPEMIEFIKPSATSYDTWDDGRIRNWADRHRPRYAAQCGGERLPTSTLFANRPDVLLWVAERTGQLG